MSVGKSKIMKDAERIRKGQEQSLQETSKYDKVLEDIEKIAKANAEERNYLCGWRLTQFDINKLRSEGFGVTEREDQRGQWIGYAIRW